MNIKLTNDIYNDILLQAMLREDLASFIRKVFHTVNPGTNYEHNWHINLIADYLTAVKNGDIKRLIINVPPRSLKSICASVAWPAWLLGHNSANRIMDASYSAVLSVKHSLDCRQVLNSDWYKQLFPKTILSKNHNQKSKFLTQNNGFRFATSVGGSATGEGGDFLLIDDPHNPLHINSKKLRNRTIDWFEQTFLTRLNDKDKGAVVIIMQRLHVDDLSGYLLNNNAWQHLKIPAQASSKLYFSIGCKNYIFPKNNSLHLERDKIETLQALEHDIGKSNYAAQYLQEPMQDNHNLLQMEDISFYEQLPLAFDYYVQSWDTAIKVSDRADYSVASVWGVREKKYYLVDMKRQKLTYPDLKTMAKKLSEKYRPKFILIEDKASGQQLLQDLRCENFNNLIGLKPKLDKITRFAACVGIFQTGQVLLPNKSDFNNILLNELTNFPHSKHDDIIDSVSQFLNYINQLKAETQPRIREL